MDQDNWNEWATTRATRGLPEHPYRLHRFTVADRFQLGELEPVGEGVELHAGLVVHRGSDRLVAWFPVDWDQILAHGILKPGATIFVYRTIRDVPLDAEST